MGQFWRTSAVTGAGLFLETCTFYLIIAVITVTLRQPEAAIPFWLVLLALVWAFLLSFYVQTLRFSLNLRGVFGLTVSALSLLALLNLNSGLGFLPVGKIISGDAHTAFVLVLTLIFLILLWWRGSTIAHDDVTLDTVRGTFQRGLVVIFVAVLIDSLMSASIISGFLVVGYFGVGLAALSVARFSSESGDTQIMSLDWWIPIGASVGAVLLLALLLSAVGLGGLDDVTRAILSMVGTAGLWILKPVLLALGYLASLLVGLAHWLAGVFGGGDLAAMLEAQEQLRQFHESLEQRAGDAGPPAVLMALLKWGAFLAGVGLAGWLLYRIFRFRRLRREPGEVQETRESLFSWSKAGQDLAALLNGWWNSLPVAGVAQRRNLEPRNPREFYHSLLALAARLDHPRREWQTPREHQGELAAVLPSGPVERIINGFQSSFYGQAMVRDNELEELRLAWTTIQQSLAPQQPGQ